MRTALLTCVLALCVLYNASAAKSNPLSAIRPFQHDVTENGTTQIDIRCTAWATIYKQTHVWITAFHCLDFDEEGKAITHAKYYVDGKPVVLLYGEYEELLFSDIAIFSGGPSSDWLPLALAAPQPLTPIWTSGYPFGYERQHTIAGVFSNIRADDGFSLYSLPVAPGMSGAPILTANNYVIGIMRRSECGKEHSWCPMSAGMPLEQMRRVLKDE